MREITELRGRTYKVDLGNMPEDESTTFWPSTLAPV